MCGLICIFWAWASTFYIDGNNVSTGVCHRVQVTCSTFCEVLGESWWGGVLPYMTAHISLVYDLWPCPLSSLIACDCTVAQSAAPRPLSPPLPLFFCLPRSLSLRPLRSVAHRGPWAPPLSACSALLCTLWHWRYVCVCVWACACVYICACVWLLF